MKKLQKIVDQIRERGKDPYEFPVLLEELKAQGVTIEKDELLEFIDDNKRLGFHTTPNHISKLMAGIGRFFEPASVIDISCGLGNILFYIDYAEDITGVEINGSIAALTQYLNPEWNIIRADTLKYSFERTYGLVISNFPMGYKPIMGKQGRKQKLEEAFVEKALSLLNPGGALVFLIPDSFLSLESSKPLREKILDEYSLEMVISLPSGSVQNTFVKPSIVVVKNTPPTGRTFFYSGESLAPGELLAAYQKEDLRYWVEKDRLKERWDYEYVNSGYHTLVSGLEDQFAKPLKELANIRRGVPITNDLKKEEGEFFVATIKNLGNQDIVRTGKDFFINKEELITYKHITLKRFNEAIVQKGDVLIPRHFGKYKPLVIQEEPKQRTIISDSLYLIRSHNSAYIASYLSSQDGIGVFVKQAKILTSGDTIPFLNMRDLGSILIPVVPVKDLNQLTEQNIKEAEPEELNELQAIVSRFFSKQLPTMVREPEPVYSDRLQVPIEELFYHFFELIGESLSANLSTQLQPIISGIEKLDKKVDLVLVEVQKVFREFQKIKESNRDENIKIMRMYRSIDERLGSLQKDRRTIEDLIKEIQSWFHFWHLLEKESQQFLPMAEYLYDELHNLENPDFSPFIVQYCRVVENELWKKIFIAYHDHLQEKRINLDNIIEFDITPENESKALKFASSIKRDKREYTLGEIHWIISLLKISGNTYKNSLLLQNFRPFILQHFDEGLLQKPFLDKMEILKNDYRNKSAHPYPMNMDAATQFYDFIKNFLVELFENYKQQDYGVRHQ